MIFAIQTKKITKWFGYFILAVSLLMSSAVPVGASGQVARQNGVVIYQVQTGNAAGASHELVTLYNNSDKLIDVTNWCIIYASASDMTQTTLSCFIPPDTTTNILLKSHRMAVASTAEFLSSSPEFKSDITFASGIAGTSGHIKLLDKAKNTIDVVGWGTATKPEGVAVQTHPADKLLQRHNVGQYAQDTDNNQADFFHAALESVATDGLIEEHVERETIPLTVTELLPDATGSDTGNEFIEIYNPNDVAVSLKEYALQSGPSFSKTYNLPDIILESRKYIALTDTQTTLSLTNTSSSVRLVDSYGGVISETDSYLDPGEGAAWALLDGVWQLTYQPTPGAENISQPSKPCPEGQVRGVTGYCKSTGTFVEGPPIPCKSDQERNPQTGRCKKIPTTLLACKAGQARNPGTGRCRSILSSSRSVLPCKAGQQRSAETNRCRKIPQINKPANVKDVSSPILQNNAKWWFAGFASIGSVGYAVFEWRRDLWKLVLHLRGG